MLYRTVLAVELGTGRFPRHEILWGCSCDSRVIGRRYGRKPQRLLGRWIGSTACLYRLARLTVCVLGAPRDMHMALSSNFCRESFPAEGILEGPSSKKFPAALVQKELERAADQLRCFRSIGFYQKRSYSEGLRSKVHAASSGSWACSKRGIENDQRR
jgi:hypothetical protein